MPEAWTTVRQAETVALARRSFAFLEELGSQTDEVARSWDVVIIHVLEELTFEIELDWRDGAVFVLVCRTIGSTRPPGYYMHDGVRVRRHLPDAMSTAGLDGEAATLRLREVLNPSGPDAMAAQLGVYRELLEGCVATLLSQARVIYPDGGD